MGLTAKDEALIKTTKSAFPDCIEYGGGGVYARLGEDDYGQFYLVTVLKIEHNSRTNESELLPQDEQYIRIFDFRMEGFHYFLGPYHSGSKKSFIPQTYVSKVIPQEKSFNFDRDLKYSFIEDSDNALEERKNFELEQVKKHIFKDLTDENLENALLEMEKEESLNTGYQNTTKSK